MCGQFDDFLLSFFWGNFPCKLILQESHLNIFSILATVISIYTFLCIIRIFLSWIPGAEYSGFGRFLSAVCDPYLNLFSKLRFLRFGMLDLSPMVAICILWGGSYIFSSLATGGKLTVGFISSLIVSMLWNVFSSILIFFAILLLIRLIVLMVSQTTYGTIWDSLDRSISPIIFAMTSMFYKGRSISFKGALVISFIECVVLYVLGKLLIEGMLCPLLMNLPI